MYGKHKVSDGSIGGISVRRKKIFVDALGERSVGYGRGMQVGEVFKQVCSMLVYHEIQKLGMPVQNI